MSLFVVGLGEVLWDMFPKGKRLGGAPANFAYHAAQFGHEGLVVSAIGLDKLDVITRLFGFKMAGEEVLCRRLMEILNTRMAPGMTKFK